MNRYRSQVTAALLLLLLACSRPTELQQKLGRLQTVQLTRPEQRTLRELDLSGDGRLDAGDWSVLEAVARAAQSTPPKSIFEGLYHGLSENTPSPFASLRAAGDEIDVSAVAPAALPVLAAEARYMAQQARMAALLGTPADGRTFGGLFSASLPGYQKDTISPASLCALVDKIDLSPFVRAGITPCAISDLDSTVWDGNVTDPFLAALIHRGLLTEGGNASLKEFLKTRAGIDPAQIEANDAQANAEMLLTRATDPAVPAAERVDAKDLFYNIVAAMRGLTQEQAEEAARVAFEQGSGEYIPWVGKIFADRDGCTMRRVVERMQERGITVYLLSATPDVVAWEGGHLLGVPHERTLGSLLEIKDGRYTGALRDSTYYSKSAIMRQWLPSPPLLAFGDSARSDFAMLAEAAGTGFMINARADLRARDAGEASERLVTVYFSGTIADPNGGHLGGLANP